MPSRNLFGRAASATWPLIVLGLRGFGPVEGVHLAAPPRDPPTDTKVRRKCFVLAILIALNVVADGINRGAQQFGHILYI